MVLPREDSTQPQSVAVILSPAFFTFAGQLLVVRSHCTTFVSLVVLYSLALARA